MARFRAGAGLDARVAARFAVPAAGRLADDLADRMRANAPDAALWLCFAPDTRVAAPGVLGVSRRVEEAELLRLTFGPPAGVGANRILTVTADHQILTADGWVEAHRLKVGAYALGGAALGRESVVAPDEHHGPPTIAEVFRAACLAAAARPERVVGRVLDLDGDSGVAVDHSDVEVVPVDGVLRDELHAHARQMFPEWVLGSTDFDLAAALLGRRLRGQRLWGTTPTLRRLRSLADRLQRRLRVAHPAQPVGVRQRAGGGLLLDQEPTHGRLAAPVASGEHPLAVALGVELCELLTVDVISASCHVYDLLTERGWLLADGIVAHNCAQDERVRPTHRDADGQTIPDNLRYVIEKASGGAELARAPRDPDLSVGNRIACRCLSVAVPGAVAERVGTSDVVLTGTAARATVSVQFPRIVESEHPDVGDGGGGWARRSIEETAAGVSRAR